MLCSVQELELTVTVLCGLQVAVRVMFCPGGGGRHSAGKKERNVISVNDRVSVFLELADAHRLLGEQVRLSAYFYDTSCFSCWQTARCGRWECSGVVRVSGT